MGVDVGVSARSMKDSSFWGALVMHGKNFATYAKKKYDDDMLRKELDRLSEFERKVERLGMRVDELKKMHLQRTAEESDSE